MCSSAAAAAALAACVLDNPAFDESTIGATSSPTSLTSPTATTVTTATTATTDPSGATTTVGSSTTAGESATSTGGETTTTTGTTTTGEPADCWGLDPDVWEIEPIDDASLGLNPRSTRLSGDGLRLYYLAESPARPYRSERASVDDPFLVGAMFPLWDAAGGAGELTVLADETEMILTRDDANGTAIQVSVKEANTWSTPTILANLNTQKSERWSTLTGDGSRVMFTRQIGDFNPYLGTEMLRFLEAERMADATPGTDFSAPVVVDLPGITDDDYAHPLFCPSLSPDGLTLHFGSSYPLILTAENATGSLQIHRVTRETTGSPWSESTVITSFKKEGWESCPWSISADGCQMTFQHSKNPPMGEPDPVRMMLARRSP